MAPVGRPAGRALTRPAPTVGLVGLHGYGASHLRALDRLSALGRARLVAGADVVAPAAAEAETLRRLGARYFADWRQMLEASPGLDVAVIATPPHLHAEMCLAALGSGVSVLVEKPPVVSVRDAEALLAAATANGVFCQVGFQSLGSGALDRLRQLLLGGGLGRPTRLVATGLWQRSRAYWARSGWAGKESLGGDPVRDGALSNPFAHALMNCLALIGDGTDRSPAVVEVEVERLRANDIEVEDTGCLRVALADNDSFLVAVTLCAEQPEAPALRLEGPLGSATWSYEGDEIRFAASSRSWSEAFCRTSLLDDLLAAVVGGDPAILCCPLERTRQFVSVVESVHLAPVVEVPPEHVRWTAAGDSSRAEIVGVGSAIRRARDTGMLFAELGVPWAVGAKRSRPDAGATPGNGPVPPGTSEKERS